MIVLIIGAVGGAVAGAMWWKGQQVAEAIAALDAMKAPQDWNVSTKTSKTKRAAWNAVGVLYDFGESAVAPLRERLNGEAGPGLEGALVALGRLEDYESVPAMAGFLKGSDARAAHAAAYAVARLGNFPKAVTALLEDPELPSERKVDVYQAHAWSRDKEARRQVAKGLEDPDGAIRALAVKVLGRLRGPEAHEALVTALLDESPEVGTAAAQSLSERSSDDRSKGGRAKLLAYCTHERADVRARALAVCAATHEIKAGPDGVNALDDPDAAVATAAAKMVEAAQVKEAAPKLVAMLTRSEAEVVAAVSDALKKVGEGSIDTLLLDLLGHDQMHTRIAAAELLAFIDDLEIKATMRKRPWQLVDAPYVPRLIACLGAGNDQLAAAANNALAALARLTHFKNKDRRSDAWQQWFDKLKVERDKIGEIEQIWNAAVDCFEARKTDEYKTHIHKMRDAVAMYEELKELGASTNYEPGAFGIKKLNEQIWIMQKTAGGF